MVQEENREEKDNCHVENSLLTKIEGSRGTRRLFGGFCNQRLKIAIGFFLDLIVDLFVHCLFFASTLEILLCGMEGRVDQNV